MRFKITNDSVLSFDLIDTSTKKVLYTFQDRQVAIDMCRILNELVKE